MEEQGATKIYNNEPIPGVRVREALPRLLTALLYLYCTVRAQGRIVETVTYTYHTAR